MVTQKRIYSGNSLAGSMAVGRESCPMSDENCVVEDLVTPVSASANLWDAFLLIKEALQTLPMLTYVSFILSLLFLFLFIKPFFSNEKPSLTSTNMRKLISRQ